MREYENKIKIKRLWCVAVYVDPLSAESIAEETRAVLEDSTFASELRQKGLKRAAGFSWEKCAREHVELFKNLM